MDTKSIMKLGATVPPVVFTLFIGFMGPISMFAVMIKTLQALSNKTFRMCIGSIVATACLIVLVHLRNFRTVSNLAGHQAVVVHTLAHGPLQAPTHKATYVVDVQVSAVTN